MLTTTDYPFLAFVGVLDIHHVGKFLTGTHQHNARQSSQHLPAADKYPRRDGKIVADLCKGEYNGLPDRDARTIRDLIHYQYAKIIARSAFSVPDGTAAKVNHYGFIKQTFRETSQKVIYLFPLLPWRWPGRCSGVWDTKSLRQQMRAKH